MSSRVMKTMAETRVSRTESSQEGCLEELSLKASQRPIAELRTFQAGEESTVEARSWKWAEQAPD